MRFSFYKYCFVYIAPAIVWFSLTMAGIWSYSAIFFVFVCIPILEFILRGTEQNMTEWEEAMALENKIYDYIIWSLVPLQLATLFYFLVQIGDPSLKLWEKLGMMTAFGISCGVLGINVAAMRTERLTLFCNSLTLPGQW